MPLFSVVIPLYNKQNFILEAVRSVLAQTISDFEVIIVDDASTDESLSLVESIKDKRVRIVKRLIPGPGGYAARNTGAEHAAAEWLTFLDADDRWMHDHLAQISSVIKSHPDVSFIHTGFRKISKITSDVLFTKLTFLKPDAAIRVLSMRDIFHINSTAVKKQTYIRSGGFLTSKGWSRGGDSELWPRLLVASSGVVMVPCVTSVWDIRNSGVTVQQFHESQQHPALVSYYENTPESQSRNFRRSQFSFAARKQLMWDAKAPFGSKSLWQSLRLYLRAPKSRRTSKELIRLVRRKVKASF